MTLATGTLGFPDPLSSPQDWDAIVVGGVRSPGIATVTDAKRENAWDVKRGKGAKGATITYTGDVPAEPKVVLTFWTVQHFADWQAFRSLLKYDPSKRTIQAIDIYHPALADSEITSVVTKSISSITAVGPTKWEVTIEFLEFRPAKNAGVGTPSTSTASGKGSGAGGAGSNAAPGDAPDPIAEAQIKEIERLQKKAAAP